MMILYLWSARFARCERARREARAKQALAIAQMDDDCMIKDSNAGDGAGPVLMGSERLQEQKMKAQGFDPAAEDSATILDIDHPEGHLLYQSVPQEQGVRESEFQASQATQRTSLSSVAVWPGQSFQVDQIGPRDQPCLALNYGIADRVSKTNAQAKPEEEAPTEDPGPEHPDFSGNWLMTGYEGDAEKFMLDLGLGWAVRKLAKSLGMGVNKTKSDIVHDLVKNTLTITNTDAQNKQSNLFLEINGTEQISTVDGNSQYAAPRWSTDGQMIEAECRDEKGPMPSSKRFLVSPTEMHVRLTTSNFHQTIGGAD